MFCTNCGCKLDDNAKFCHQCGTFVGDINNNSTPDTSKSAGGSGFFVANDLDNQVSNGQDSGFSGSGYEYSDFEEEKTIRVRRPRNAEYSSREKSYNNYNSAPSGDAYNYNSTPSGDAYNYNSTPSGDAYNNYNSASSRNAYTENSGRTGTEPYNNAAEGSYRNSNNGSYSNSAGNSYNSSYSAYGNDSNSNSSYGNSSYSAYGNDSNSNGSYGNSSYDNYGNVGSSYYGGTPSDDWKDEISPQNLEKFAPLAAFMPLVAGVLRVILRIILGIVFPFNYYLRFRFVNILSLVFFIVATAATGYLIYVVVTKKNAASINSWITPIGTLIAAISCLGMWRYWRIIPIVFGIVAVLMGLEFLARIVIAGEDITSPFNPGAAAATYSWYFKNYKDQYPTSKQMERAGYVDPEKSYFDGTGIEVLGYSVLTVLVCAVTCGLAFPWMYCKLTRWRLEHTVINDKRLTFTGSGGSLFGHWILWEILTVVTCGIYGFFVYCALRRWELEHTFIQGEPVYANDKVSRFDGATLPFIGYSLLAGLGTLLTCGIAFPWMMTMIQRWDTEHQIINNRRLKYSGTGIGFFGEFLIIAVLSFITCGIYSFWGIVRMNKYIIRNTDFVDYIA